MSGPPRQSGQHHNLGQGQGQGQGYPPPLPRSSLPSFPLPGPDSHTFSHQHQQRQPIPYEEPIAQGLQSFAASPEEWDDSEIPTASSPGKWKALQGYDRKPVATRRRVVQSCSECRRRKIKCDKKFPCGPCILREDQEKCHEVGMAEKHIVASTTHHATTAELATVAHRLDALEAALIKNRCILPADIDNYVRSAISMYPTEEPSTRRKETTTAAPIAGPSGSAPEMDNGHNIPPKMDDDTEDAALTIEHLTFGRSRVVGGHSMPYFGASHPSSIGRREPNNDYHLARTSHSSPIGNASALHQHSNIRGGSGSPGRPGQPARKSSLNVQVKSVKAEPMNLPPKRFADTLSHEEKMARLDALLDIMEPTDLVDMFWRKTDVAMRYLMMIFPDAEKGKFLVNAFVEKVDWLHRCIHIPSFLRQCNDLWNLPSEKVIDEIAMPFIALYVTVCTLGLSFSDSADVAKHFNPEDVPKLVDQWYSGVRAAMYASDMMGDHTIEHCQSLLLLSVLMNNRDRAEAAWALMGSVIKMAQNLGMSRLGAEQQAENGKPLSTWTGRWESLIQREVGRRIWWNLVFLDWSLAPSYSFSTSITPDQIKTALPANIEDEDLIDGEPLRAQPLNVRTKMSYQLARLKFSELVYKQIWQANNGGNPPYSWVEIRRTMLELPRFFQPTPTESNVPPLSDPKAMVEYYEKTTLNLGVHSRMMRLHRPWLSRGYDDERFSYSKEQCIRAARAGLRLMCGGENNHVAQFLEKWWIPLFHVSVSAMVVIIDLLRTNKRDMHSSETERKIEEVKGSLDNMRLIKDVSPSAKATVRVMDFLLAEVEERRRPANPGKRKATSPPDESDDGLQRAVKKLIRQAQLEADSPTNISGSGHSGGTPNEHDPLGQLSRSSSRERPVFDAYPMPPVPSGVQIDEARSRATTTRPPVNTKGNSNVQIPPPRNDSVSYPQQIPNSNSNQNQNQNQNQGQNIQSNQNTFFPPNQSFDTNSQMFNYVPSPYTYQFPTDPTLDFPQIFPNQGQPLDPAVESMLASYFPQNDVQNGQPTQGAVPGSVGPEDFLSRVFSFGWNDAANGGGNGNGNSDGQGGGNNRTGGNGQGGQGMGDVSGGFGFGDAWGGGGGGWMA